jgi:predicted RNase H-like nuclease
MTDEQIIKALECCGNIVDSTCKGCVYHKTYNASCVVLLMRDALDLFNRQKAELSKKDTEIDILIRKKEALRDEISELKAEIERLEFDNVHWNDWEVKCRAIKEFWSKLKTHTRKMKSSDFSGEFWDKAILVEDGDNLVKEMTERKEDK